VGRNCWSRDNNNNENPILSMSSELSYPRQGKIQNASPADSHSRWALNGRDITDRESAGLGWSGGVSGGSRECSSSNMESFIVNVQCLPDPFLVDMSRRTKTERKTVEFYEPNVLYCPREMEPILKAILDDGELFKYHR
jgi:hypothetical protein